MDVQPPPVGDRAELAEILEDLARLLQDALLEHEDWFAEDVRAHLRDAWPHVEPRITFAIHYLRTPPSFEDLDFELREVGLVGPESEPKKQGARAAFRRWFRAPSKRAFRSVLGWLNIILGSLSGVVPGIDAVKEYKEACEQAIEDGDLEAEERAG